MEPARPAGNPIPETVEADNAGTAPAGIWGHEVPSRYSLAKLAYPGLVTSARHFNWMIYFVVGLLVFWLVITCMLSWDIALGQAISARLDTTESSMAEIRKRAPDTEARSKADTSDYALLQAADADSRQDLADWLAPWSWVKKLSQHLSGRTGAAGPTSQADTIDERQWAAALLQVLATAVLPLFYGVLGAGAAVVRSLWSKTRDSLLGRRDVLLSLGQLAQGAVIGACIGLFVTPSGAAAAATAFTGAASLTPSALSFIAGFGVDAVFIALESLIKRVFNIPEQKPQ